MKQLQSYLLMKMNLQIILDKHIAQCELFANNSLGLLKM